MAYDSFPHHVPKTLLSRSQVLCSREDPHMFGEDVISILSLRMKGAPLWLSQSHLSSGFWSHVLLQLMSILYQVTSVTEITGRGEAAGPGVLSLPAASWEFSCDLT